MGFLCKANQTVKIKEIGSLNTFIREHMLGKGDIQKNIQSLQDNYQNLTRAHAAIVKAKAQLELLTPLHEDSLRYHKLEERIKHLRQAERLVPAYFAQQKLQLLGTKLEQAQIQLEHVSQQLDRIIEHLVGLNSERRQLDVAIGSDEVGQRLKLLEKDIELLQKQLSFKQQQAETYDSLASRLGLSHYQTKETFYDAKERAEQLHKTSQESLDEAFDERVGLQTQVDKLKVEGETLAREIDSLQQRDSQIPQRNLELRQGMVNALNIPGEAVSFVGELLKVKDDERHWEGAVERLLHSFGLCLLVPEPHYQAVSYYVNTTNLHGRIVFHRIDKTPLPLPTYGNPGKLADKLEIKQSPFYDWIGHELIKHYDYTCCDTLEQFRQEKRALTAQGLIKSGNQRHEKDDRRDLRDRTRYILGWSNKEKIAALERERDKVAEQFSEVRRNLEKVEKKRRDLETKKGQVEAFLRFDDFAAIDWQSAKQTLQELQKQKIDLEQSSDRLKHLQAQLEALQDKTSNLEVDRNDTQKEQLGLERDIEDYRKQQRQAQLRLEEASTKELEACSPHIEKHLTSRQLTLDTMDTVERQTQDIYRKLLEKDSEETRRLENSIVRRMQKYKSIYEAETTEVDAAIESISDFDALLETIKKDDLPRFEAEFKRFLNDKILSNMVVFRGELESRLNGIKDNINTLNGSLKSIDYTPRTFIELRYGDNSDPEIREFKTMLKACFVDVGSSDELAGEASFQPIRALIERFENEVRWTNKVTDVRNWLDFSASENYRTDGSQRHYYSDSSGKSGGQKAKLAYTILASAIAYQFGLDHGQARSTSFRFVVIDEAFDKTDERNAHYAMELFKQLDLQLLVVTPLDKVHVIEPFISACHFVENSLEEDDSKVYNLSMTDFDERKQSFRAKFDQ